MDSNIFFQFGSQETNFGLAEVFSFSIFSKPVFLFFFNSWKFGKPFLFEHKVFSWFFPLTVFCIS